MEDNKDLLDSFNRFKNLVYTNTYKKYKLNEIAYLIKKPNKTKKEKEAIVKIAKYIKTINEAIQTLGTKLISIDSSDNEFIDITNKKLEEHVKDIIYQFSIFVDALAAIGRSYKFNRSSFNLKKSTTYLKAIRNKFVQKSSEFKLKIIRNKNEEQIFISHIKDVINIFLSEAYALRISVLYNKFKELEDDSIYSN